MFPHVEFSCFLFFLDGLLPKTCFACSPKIWEKECKRHMLTRTKSRLEPTAACILGVERGASELRGASWSDTVRECAEWQHAKPKGFTANLYTSKNRICAGNGSTIYSGQYRNIYE